MAESYFDLLTKQQEFPVKPFDPLEEVKRLRRMLALRIQQSESPEKTDTLPFLEEIDKEPSLPASTSLEMVVKQVNVLKKTLTVWQRARRSAKLPRGVFRGHRRFWNKGNIPVVIIPSPDTSCQSTPHQSISYQNIPYQNAPQEKTLEMLNAGLMALGVVGIIFGILSFLRGWESDLSLGSLVSVSGVAIVAIGLGGRFLVSHSEDNKESLA
jgi:hypothetical protein